MVVTGLYWVVRRAYTVASCDALSWLVHGGCTACYVISVPLVLCSSLFGTLVFLSDLINSISFGWGVVFGVIPRLYTGLYATPGPLLAAPSCF